MNEDKVNRIVTIIGAAAARRRPPRGRKGAPRRRTLTRRRTTRTRARMYIQTRRPVPPTHARHPRAKYLESRARRSTLVYGRLLGTRRTMRPDSFAVGSDPSDLVPVADFASPRPRRFAPSIVRLPLHLVEASREFARVVEEYPFRVRDGVVERLLLGPSPDVAFRRAGERRTGNLRNPNAGFAYSAGAPLVLFTPPRRGHHAMTNSYLCFSAWHSRPMARMKSEPKSTGYTTYQNPRIVWRRCRRRQRRTPRRAGARFPSTS